jgi:L-lactate dehydrogenase complex protein LldF
MEHSQSLPYASSLCGACYEVCPVKIDIPEILIHLRRRIVEGGDAPWGEKIAMKVAAFGLADSGRIALGQKLARIAHKPFEHFMMAAWTESRDLPEIPKESFREWWSKRSPRS